MPSQGTEAPTDRVDQASPPASTRARRAARPWPPARTDALATAGLVLLAVAVLGAQRAVVARQLWVDEQWRAYHLSVTDGFWRELGGANAPMGLLWLGAERLAVAVAGNNLLALRLPVLAAFVALGPLAYAVARRWLGGAASWATAALLVLNGPLFVYAVQLKPFVLDGVASLGALWCWLAARDPGRRPAIRLLLYLAIAACSMLAVAASFTVGFLLVLDLVEFLRRRQRPAQLAAPVAAGALSAAHLLLVVLRQDAVAETSHWQDRYLPLGSAAEALGFVPKQLASFVPGMVTQVPRYVPVPADPALPLGWGLRPVLTGFVLLALGAGVVAALVGGRGRLLAGLLAWCLALQLAASAAHRWPFGLVRVNYFLLPLLYLLGGLGLASGFAVAATRARRGLRLALAVATAAGCLALLGAARAQVAEALRTADGPVYELGMADQVAWTRLRTTPGAGDVVVFYDGTNWKGWAYYMRFYEGYDPTTAAAPRIGPERTLLLPRSADAEPLRRLLDGDRSVGSVFLVLPVNARPDRVRAIGQVLAAHGYRPVASRRALITSTVQQFTRPSTGG